MENTSDLNKLELYTEGKLTGKELEDFQNRLQSDTALQQELKSYKAAVESLKIQGRAEIRNKLRAIHQDTVNKQGRTFYPLWFKVAAVIIGIMILSSPLIYIQITSQTDFEQIFAGENWMAAND